MIEEIISKIQILGTIALGIIKGLWENRELVNLILFGILFIKPIRKLFK